MNLEEGNYLALDVGGTNVRVILLKVSKGKIVDQIIEYYHIPEAVRQGPATDLFDYLANCIVQFFGNQGISPKGIPLGETTIFQNSQ